MQKRSDQWYNEFHNELIDRARQDPLCCDDKKSCIELEELVDKLELSRHQRCVINDYIACLLTLSERHMELAYDLGRDVMSEIVKEQEQTIQ
ncbi:MAG: hypothetical protein IJ411_00110 [Oscillospiraceae bacterium]|nr:hypothetical protein [Oscillospiraceae bacterium]